MDISEKALQLHKELKGKITVNSKKQIKDNVELSLVYTPGVASPCLAIAKDPNAVYDYTSKGNLVAIVSDGTAVLGLGDIGPKAAIPVMEGKAVLFKEFAGVDAFPICLDTTDIDEIVRTVELISPVFGGVNLEDIKAPNCFEIERRLKEKLDIPVFHDDQHGTAIVISAALINALKLAGKNLEDITIVVNGLGAAGTATIKLLSSMGVGNLRLCDINGMLFEGQFAVGDDIEKIIQKNKEDKTSLASLAEALKGADLFIGVSAANLLNKDMVKSMAKDPILFALANPTPEIMPDVALEAGARIISTGRSDFPNQINNVLAFPGIFRGALDARASDINDAMKIAAVNAISGLIDESELSDTNIIPGVFDKRVAKAVANAVEKAAVDSGVARI